MNDSRFLRNKDMKILEFLIDLSHRDKYYGFCSLKQQSFYVKLCNFLYMAFLHLFFLYQKPKFKKGSAVQLASNIKRGKVVDISWSIAFDRFSYEVMTEENKKVFATEDSLLRE